VTAYGDITRTFTLRERLRRIRERDGVDRLLEAGELAQALADVECAGHAGAVTAAAWPPHSKLTSKVPEGYAYYAVYPELYERAAKRAGPKTRRRVVIGIRTIGTSLGRVVADAVDADEFFTVRPIGHPFHREVKLDRELDPEAEYFVVDEGPGLSGSSFAAVAAVIPSEHLYFLPSHGNGPGPQADDAVRAAWARARVLVEEFAFDPRWIEPLVGRVETVEDLGGGAWRKIVGDAPAWIGKERRKVLVNGRYLAKFAGLGAYGREKLDKARCLEGLIPRVVGLANGFLVSEWIDGTFASDREALLDAVRRYLAVVATLRAPSWRSSAPIAPPSIDIELVDVDNRMHPWEWIATAAGDIVKCDALDHSAAHDGVGVQDLAWDVAGAMVEHGFSAEELGVACDAKLAFFIGAYAAKQSAIFHQAASESPAEEAVKLEERARFYDSQ
jgi:hypothetical protein